MSETLKKKKSSILDTCLARRFKTLKWTRNEKCVKTGEFNSFQHCNNVRILILEHKKIIIQNNT